LRARISLLESRNEELQKALASSSFGLSDVEMDLLRTLEVANEDLRREVRQRLKTEEALGIQQRYLSVLVEIQQILLGCPPDESELDGRVLKQLQKVSGASRVYLFVTHYGSQGQLLISQRCECVAEGISPQIENPSLQNIRLEENFPWETEILRRGEIWSARATGYTPSQRALLEPQGILSILLFPLMVEGEFSGLIGFDNCVDEREWQQPEKDLLQAAANAISLYLERKQSEQDRRRLDAKLVRTHKFESLEALAGGIAHDFNNLLTVIQGHAELVLMDLPAGSPIQPSLEQIITVVHRATQLTQQMLAYSGRGSLVLQRVGVSEMIQEMSGVLAASVSGKSLIHYELARGLPLIEGDAEQIRQVVIDLVLNASEAIEGSGGEIHIRTGSLDCDTDYLAACESGENRPEGRYVFIEVADNGCGMTAETKARLFDPFFTTKFTGRGLGLAAVLGIVRGHRGAIRVSSQTGRGATLRVVFPAVGQTEMEGEPVHGIAKAEAGIILVVDDEEFVRDLAKMLLEREGFEVVTASNGLEAVEVFRANPDGIAAILLDLTMPVMDGETALLEIRKIRGEVPVLLSSGYSKQDATIRFLVRGLAGFIQKPYTRTDLVSAIRQMLGQ
jgi:signal transduction histidine kinase/CheY-like chemotaxis protein